MPKLKEAQEETAKNHKKISEEIWKLNDDLYKHQAQDHNSKSNNDPLLKRLDELEAKLNEHLKDHSSFSNTRVLSTNRKTELGEWTPKPEHKQKEKEKEEDMNASNR